MKHFKIGDIDPEDLAEVIELEQWTHEATLIKKHRVTHNTFIFSFMFDTDDFEMELLPGQHISLDN